MNDYSVIKPTIDTIFKITGYQFCDVRIREFQDVYYKQHCVCQKIQISSYKKIEENIF